MLLLLMFRLFAGGAEAAYATAEVQRGGLTVTVSATGNLQPTNKVEVRPVQSRLVTDVYVQINERLLRGQPTSSPPPSRIPATILQNPAAATHAHDTCSSLPQLDK